MKYIIKNLKYSFQKNAPMMFLAISTVVISCLTMLFAYGVYVHMKREIATKTTHVYDHVIKCNYTYKRVGQHRLIRDENGKKIKDTYENRYMEWQDAGKYELKRGKKVKKAATVGQLKGFCRELSDVFCDNLDLIAARSEIDGNMVCYEFSVKDGKITQSSTIEKSLLEDSLFGLHEGRYFTGDEVENGEQVGLYYDFHTKSPNSMYHKFLDSIMDPDLEHFTLQGKRYRVIGSYFDIDPQNTNREIASPIDSVSVPVTAVEDDTILVEEVDFFFKQPMSKPNYDEIVRLSKKHFGSLMDPGEVDLVENPDSYLHRSILIVAVCIALISAVNFVVIYRFILMTRVRELSIFRLCGMTYIRSAFSYIIECLLLTVPSFLLSCLFYARFLIHIVGKNFYYMKESYDMQVYQIMFLIYFLVSFVSICAMVFATIRRREVFM